MMKAATLARSSPTPPITHFLRRNSFSLACRRVFIISLSTGFNYRILQVGQRENNVHSPQVLSRWKGLRWAMPSKVSIASEKQNKNPQAPYDSKATGKENRRMKEEGGGRRSGQLTGSPSSFLPRFGQRNERREKRKGTRFPGLGAFNHRHTHKREMKRLKGARCRRTQ